jgi:heat shock protein HslJ
MKFTFLPIISILSLLLLSCDKADIEILVETDWVAESIQRENGIILTPDADYILSFENDHQFGLKLDINLCGGRVDFKKETVDFSEGIYCTRACCDSEFANTLIQLLPENTHWKLSNNQLIFSNKQGLEILFRKN